MFNVLKQNTKTKETNASNKSTLSTLDSRLSTPKGFSLIELILYLAIFSVLLLVFTQIFTWILDIQQESHSTSSLYQDSEYIINRLNYDIKRAQSVDIPANPGDQSTSLQLTIDGINYTYEISNGNLILVNNFGTNLVNGTNTTISGLSFKKIGNINGKSTVNLSFVLISRIKQGGVGFRNTTFQTTIGTR